VILIGFFYSFLFKSKTYFSIVRSPYITTIPDNTFSLNDILITFEKGDEKCQIKKNMGAKNSFFVLYLGIIAFGFGLLSCQSNNKINDYQGKPFSDSQYNAGAQTIPGKLQCEYYDFGGEGITFHDTDSINSGSGRLNPADGSYLHEFRINEAVDISYTKFQDPAVDNSPYNFVKPEKGQLYVGWTEPGEWVKYTVNITKKGIYKIGIMFTSNRGGKISIALDDNDITGPLSIPSTFVAADSIAWRQWHHWNYVNNMATIDLKKGLHTITLHTVESGNMNYDYINFELVKE
jgi:hypothetical protein